MAAQGGMHARAAVTPATVLVRGADLGRPRAILDRPRAFRPAGPGVVATPAHAQHLAHDLDRIVGDVLANEGIAHLRPVALPKMSAAFPKMSRSIRTRSSSRRSRPISDAWSAGLGPTRRAGAACCWVGVGAGAPLPAAVRPSAQRSQARTSRSGRPSSAATAETERPPRIAATASSLNASGKSRRCLLLSAIDTSQAVKPIWGVRETGAGPEISPRRVGVIEPAWVQLKRL